LRTIGHDLDILCVRHRLRIHDVILNASALERTPVMETNPPRRAAIKLHHAIVADLDGRLYPVGMEYRSQAG
jgi:hypothetical protein